SGKNCGHRVTWQRTADTGVGSGQDCFGHRCRMRKTAGTRSLSGRNSRVIESMGRNCGRRVIWHRLQGSKRITGTTVDSDSIWHGLRALGSSRTGLFWLDSGHRAVTRPNRDRQAGISSSCWVEGIRLNAGIWLRIGIRLSRGIRLE
ncbi:unnamed protein product, partial [Staurois parvus]